MIRAASSSDISINVSKVDTWEMSVYNLIEHGSLVIISEDDLHGCQQTERPSEYCKYIYLTLCPSVIKEIRFDKMS